jgi:hypothetical protein
MSAYKLPCGCLIERDTELILQMCSCCNAEICSAPRGSGGEISASDRQQLRDAGRGHLVRP